MLLQGYDDLRDVKALSWDERDDMFVQVQVKPGHRRRFVEALDGKEQTDPSTLECPACLNESMVDDTSGRIVEAVDRFEISTPRSCHLVADDTANDDNVDWCVLDS